MSEPKEILPPSAGEIEAAVLGCVLWDPVTCLDAVKEKALDVASFFYDLRHRRIWGAFEALAEANRPIEVLTVAQWLKERGELEQVGDYGYLTGLQDGVPSAANLEHYLDVLREKAQQRALLRLSVSAAEAAREGADLTAAIARVQSELDAICDGGPGARERHISKIIPGVIQRLEKYHRGGTQLHGFPTGLEYLDKVIQGIDRTHYVVLAARPGDGKTSLAMNIVEHLTTNYEHWEETGELHPDGKPVMRCERGIGVGVFSLEMDGESLVTRLMFGNGRADMGRWNTGMANAEDFAGLTQAAARLNKAKIWIDDLCDQTIGKIRSRARRMAKEHNIKLFVLDYIQLLDTDDDKLRNDRVRELTKISKAIVSLKKQLKIPWLVLAQMNRNIETTETKRVPVLSDLKDCGALEQDADVVLFLYKPSLKEREENQAMLDEHYGDDWTQKPSLVNAFVAKNRFGPTGKAELLFWKNMTRFEDLRRWKVDHEHVTAAKGERYTSVTADDLPTDEELGRR